MVLLMRLAVIRHAIAEDAAEFAKSRQPDGLRPLTERGRERMTRAARGIRVLLPHLDLLATSPLVRARQTAEILASEYGGIDLHETELLAPGHSPAELVEWMRSLPPGSTIATVGHEPGVSQTVTWVLSGSQSAFLRMKKGAACLLEFPGKIDGGRAELVWSLRPAHLRAIGAAQ